VSRLKTSLPESLAASAKSALAEWQSGGKVKRLWDRDASLWTGEEESQWLGWLDIVDEPLAEHHQLPQFAMDVHRRGFEHVLLLGMGGSSLCPEVLRMTFGRIPHYPELHVLDSTDPAQVRAFEHALDIPGRLPAEKPILEDSGIKLFTDDRNAAELAKSAGEKSLVGYLKAHLDRIHTGDYFAVLGYIQMNTEHEQSLETVRHAVRDKKRAATCLGFGPRFLHSTGQAYKGGPNSGVFLQVTCDDSVELPVPGQKYTFGIVKAAQARGDFQVLAERGRRALRVHLGKDLKSGLAALEAAVEKAL
jgi:hypothetical protein